jgi:hypothetical protein
MTKGTASAVPQDENTLGFAPFRKERRTLGFVWGSAQEIRGISLVFREMWDTATLDPQLHRCHLGPDLSVERFVVPHAQSSKLAAIGTRENRLHRRKAS